MRLVDYLDTLNWTQTKLADEADISTSTVKRALTSQTISRDNANAICAALSRALKRTITIADVNELQNHRPPVERGPRKKKPTPET
jgi:DNA-binding Xre family transcriptional regulator